MLNIDYIKAIAAKRNEVCLDNKYEKSSSKLLFSCAKGHLFRMSWDHYKQGHSCMKCFGTPKYHIHQVCIYMDKFGYRCLSDKYKNVLSKLDVRCPKGHTFKMSFSVFKRGHRCPKCMGNQRKTINEIIQIAQSRGEKCLSKSYKNSIEKLLFECQFGHKFKMSWAHYSKGHSCKLCSVINRTGENSYNWCGGYLLEAYCDSWFDKDYKQYIRNRDDNKCQNLYCNGGYKRLNIHHINYNKRDCSPSNLITLCASCNTKANHNRDKWYEFYSFIMANIVRGNI